MRGKKNQSTAPKIKEFNVYTCSADAPPQRVCTCVSATRKCACVCKRDSLCVEERDKGDGWEGEKDRDETSTANTPIERLGEIQSKGVRLCTGEAKSGRTSCPQIEITSAER